MIIVAPILVFVYPPAGSTKKIDIPVDLTKSLDEMQDGEAQGFNAPKETGFTMTNGGGDNYAGKIGFAGFVVKNGSDLTVFSSTCSHLGCSIAPNTSGAKRFDCPCHGSQFTLNGQVLHGPAAAPLSNYDWKRVDNNPSQIKVAGVSLPGQ